MHISLQARVLRFQKQFFSNALLCRVPIFYSLVNGSTAAARSIPCEGIYYRFYHSHAHNFCENNFLFLLLPFNQEIVKKHVQNIREEFYKAVQNFPPPNPPYWLAILFSPTTPRPVPRSPAGPLLRKGKPNSGLRAKDRLPDSTSFDP